MTSRVAVLSSASKLVKISINLVTAKSMSMSVKASITSALTTLIQKMMERLISMRIVHPRRCAT